MRVKPKGLPDGDCCSPWQKIMERLREVETGLSQRVKKVKVNGTTIYPVNDGEIRLPDYPEPGGSVESVTVDGTKYLPDAQGDVGLPNYPPDLSVRMGTAENDIDALEGSVAGLGLRMGTVEGKCDGYDNVTIPALESAVIGIGARLGTKPTMFTRTVDPTSATEGHVGDFYLNTADDKLWKCVSASEGVYGWTKVGGGTPGAEIWYADVLNPQQATSFSNGTDTKTISEMLTYIFGLTEEQRHRVFLSFKNAWYLLCQYVRADSLNNEITFVNTGSDPDSTAGTFYSTVVELKEPTVRARSHPLIMAISESWYDFQVGEPIESGYEYEIPDPVSDVGLTTELFGKYKNGDITITPDDYGGCTLTVVNGFTPTETGSVYWYMLRDPWHSPIRVFENSQYEAMGQRNVITFE